MELASLFAPSGDKIEPVAATVTSGYFPLQYLPAENANYFFNLISQANIEICNVISQAGLTPTSGTLTQLNTAISGLISINPTLTAHIAGTGTSVHGATTAATASQLMARDASGYAYAATPTFQTGATALASIGTLQTAIPVTTTVNGLVMSYATTTTFTVASGWGFDSTFTDVLHLAASTTKSTSAWAVGSGNGGLDTGAIGANTWYAVYLIKRVDTGVVDVIYSTNATIPALPANYTLYRRIGWIRTNGSSQFTNFNQQGRRFYWNSKAVDLNATPANTNRILLTVSCPKNTVGLFVFGATAIGSAFYFDSGWTALADAAASGTNQIAGVNTAGSGNEAFPYQAIVDSSNQIYYRVSATAGNTVVIQTQGWIDDL